MNTVKQPIVDWWFFVQPNGLLGCYDESDKEIREYNLSIEEAIVLSEKMANADFQYDEISLDHQGAIEDAVIESEVPSASAGESHLLRLQIALHRDSAAYGEERIEEYVQGMMAASVKEVEQSNTAWSKGLAAVCQLFGMSDNPATPISSDTDPIKSNKAARLNERFSPEYHMQDISEALVVLGEIDQGKLDARVYPTNWVYDVGPVRMQIERNETGKIDSICLGPLVGDPLHRLGLVDFKLGMTPDGYRLKYYFITDKGRSALLRLLEGDRSFLED